MFPAEVFDTFIYVSPEEMKIELQKNVRNFENVQLSITNGKSIQKTVGSYTESNYIIYYLRTAR